VLHQSKLMKLPRGRHSDGKNLYVIISRPGVGSFMYRSNKYQEGLGSIDLVTLAEAREKAAAIRKLEHEGKDPKAERRNARFERDRAKRLANKTVNKVLDEYFDDKIAFLAPSTIKTERYRVQKYVRSRIGDVPIQQVDKHMILDDSGVGFRKLWKEKNPTAERLLPHLQGMLSLAISNQYRPGPNPAAWKDNLQSNLASSRRVHTVKHRKSLPYQDIPRFMAALRALEDTSVRQSGHSTMALLIEFIVLSCVRLNEARAAKWGHIDEKRKIWTVPTGRDGNTKRKDEREVPREIPINRPMQKVLDEMKRRFPHRNAQHAGLPESPNRRRI
jgi:integrase